MKASSKFAISWLEIILVTVLVASGMGIWVFVDQQVSQNLYSQQPDLEQFQQERQLPDRQRELKLAQDELVTTRKKLIEQKIELARHIAKLQALENVYPQLSQKTIAKPPLPPDLPKTFKAAQLEQATIKGLVQALATQALSIESQVANLTKAVFKAQESSSQDLQVAKIRYEWNKRLLTLMWSAGIVACIMSVIFFIVLGLSRWRTLTINLWLIFGAALTLQFILFGYQAFSVMGAALISTFLLIAFLGTLSRRSL